MKHALFRVSDIAFSVIFIFSAYSSLNTFTRLDYPVVGIFVAIFYVCIAFGMVRLIPYVRFLVYVNALVVVLVMLGMAIFLMLTKTFYFPLLVPLFIYGLSAWYVYIRFKGVHFSSSIRLELSYFVGVILVLVAVLYIGGQYFGLGEYQPENLSGPIGIHK